MKTLSKLNIFQFNRKTLFSKRDLDFTRELLLSNTYIDHDFFRAPWRIFLEEVDKPMVGIRKNDNHFVVSMCPSPTTKNSFRPDCEVRLYEWNLGTRVELYIHTYVVTKVFFSFFVAVYILILLLSLIYGKVMQEMNGFLVLFGLFFLIGRLVFIYERKRLIDCIQNTIVKQ